jgi:hypothetical protein
LGWAVGDRAWLAFGVNFSEIALEQARMRFGDDENI